MRYRHDLTDFIDHLMGWLDEHYLGSPGAYGRHAKDRQPDPYGCADAANICYTIGHFPTDPAERAEWVNQLQSFQDPETGKFHDETHSNYHTTAHCTAALELFDARPRYPLRFLEPLLERDHLERFLDGLDWTGNPWRASHDGAGCAAALGIVGEATPSWLDWYFDWLDAHVDPHSGLWRRDQLLPMDEKPGFFANLAGSFHYHFNYVHYRRPLPYPDAVVDSCLAILESSPVSLGIESVSFKEIDWIFCINRALQQSGHRRKEVIDALLLMSDRAVTRITDQHYRTSAQFDDLHYTFGGICALAELQQALPGTIHTPRPLKLVLDRRPFI